MKRPGRLALVCGLTGLFGCAAPLYIQSGPSQAAYLSGNEAVPTPEEARRDLSREHDQDGVRVTALLQTEPYIRGVQIREGFKENVSAETMEKRIGELSKLWVQDHTTFRIDIAGVTKDDVTFKYWGAVAVDSRGQVYPADLLADGPGTETRDTIFQSNAIGSGYVNVTQSTVSTFDQTGYVIAPHIDITQPLELRLIDRNRPQTPPFTLRWSAKK